MPPSATDATSRTPPRLTVRAVATCIFALAALILLVIPTTARADDGAPDLSGRWAQKMVLTGVSDAPVIGRVTSETRSLLLVDVEHDSDTQLSLQTRVCDIQMSNDTSVVETTAPDAFVDAVPNERRSGRLEVDEAGATELVIPKHVALFGAQLRSPSSERLPRKKSHPAVTDPDGDGHPGVTIRIDGLVSGSIYLVQRSWDAWRGTVEDDRVEGTVRWDVEQSVLGASNMFLKSQPSTRPHPDRTRSWFELVSVESNTDCSEVVDRRDELFAR